MLSKFDPSLETISHKKHFCIHPGLKVPPTAYLAQKETH